jgi:hypothetical protein
VANVARGIGGTSKVSNDDSGPARARVIAKKQPFLKYPHKFTPTANFINKIRATVTVA